MSDQTTRDHVDVRILRQDGPGEDCYWERHRVRYEHDMNVISVLQKVAAQSSTADGDAVAPVAWDCNCLEEVCGACTMNINGKIRQSCSALVDQLLAEDGDTIEQLRAFWRERDRISSSIAADCFIRLSESRPGFQSMVTRTLGQGRASDERARNRITRSASA